jgi:Tfp pilus assembly protein PilX
LKTRDSREEKGTVLVLSMLLLLVATLIGISALNTSTYEIRISANERASVQAFYAAEAGINEFMGRFRNGATNEIADNDPWNPNWRVLLAKYPGQSATRTAYVSGGANSIASLQNELDFGVEIRHKTDGGNKVVTYGGVPVYILKSYGSTADGGNKVLEVELIKSPNYDPPAALYSEMPIHIHGSSIYIDGRDGCGTWNKPGIMSTSTMISPITESGSPSIEGSPPEVTQTSIPPPTDLPLRDMLNYIKADAHFKFGFNENQALSGYSAIWGTPTSNGTAVPTTYTGPMNIIYFNMQGTQTLKLTGDSHGAGILLVEGNLEIDGSFAWYGVVLTTGTIVLTGGGQKHITGGIIAGKNTTMEIDGNAGIVYCSVVSKKLKDIIPSSKITRWREIF